MTRSADRSAANRCISKQLPSDNSCLVAYPDYPAVWCSGCTHTANGTQAKSTAWAGGPSRSTLRRRRLKATQTQDLSLPDD